MSLERLDVARGLGLREGAKGERFSGDTVIGSHLIEELYEYSDPRPSLVELACRVKIARTVAGRRGHMVMRDERFSQHANALFHL